MGVLPIPSPADRAPLQCICVGFRQVSNCSPNQERIIAELDLSLNTLGRRPDSCRALYFKKSPRGIFCLYKVLDTLRAIQAPLRVCFAKTLPQRG
jgi:hypothetical protein